MIPLHDVIPSRTTPFVTIGLIAANIIAFILELTSPLGMERYIFLHGLIPAHFTWMNVLTSMFLHAGWLHIISNLWVLWIFGDNVEDRMGHVRYLLFYLLAGAAASLLETYSMPDATIPIVGASGAIAGVMGAYLFMFPHSRIHVLVLLVFLIDVVEMPAVIFLGLWFLLQIVGGVGQVASVPGEGGVAFWAHVGGFVAGALASFVFRRKERADVEWWGGRGSL